MWGHFKSENASEVKSFFAFFCKLLLDIICQCLNLTQTTVLRRKYISSTTKHFLMLKVYDVYRKFKVKFYPFFCPVDKSFFKLARHIWKSNFLFSEYKFRQFNVVLNTGGKMNVHNTFRRRPGLLSQKLLTLLTKVTGNQILVKIIMKPGLMFILSG